MRPCPEPLLSCAADPFLPWSCLDAHVCCSQQASLAGSTASGPWLQVSGNWIRDGCQRRLPCWRKHAEVRWAARASCPAGSHPGALQSKPVRPESKCFRHVPAAYPQGPSVPNLWRPCSIACAPAPSPAAASGSHGPQPSTARNPADRATALKAGPPAGGVLQRKRWFRPDRGTWGVEGETLAEVVSSRLGHLGGQIRDRPGRASSSSDRHGRRRDARVLAQTSRFGKRAMRKRHTGDHPRPVGQIAHCHGRWRTGFIGGRAGPLA